MVWPGWPAHFAARSLKNRGDRVIERRLRFIDIGAQCRICVALTGS
jgi:hypothetical protein